MDHDYGMQFLLGIEVLGGIALDCSFPINCIISEPGGGDRGIQFGEIKAEALEGSVNEFHIKYLKCIISKLTSIINVPRGRRQLRLAQIRIRLGHLRRGD